MVKVDRRVARTQLAIKEAFVELMSERNFDSITIQDIADKANVNRATVYLHYLDKFDLLDKIIEEHINNMIKLHDKNMDIFLKTEKEIDWNEYWIESIVHCMRYLERNHLFFSTMLASEGARFFRNRFVQHNIIEFKKDVDVTKGKNFEQSEEVIVEFVANAYVGVVEWWIKNNMPYPPQEMAKKVGNLLERIV